jgi:hypothetical protein
MVTLVSAWAAILGDLRAGGALAPLYPVGAPVLICPNGWLYLAANVRAGTQICTTWHRTWYHSAHSKPLCCIIVTTQPLGTTVGHQIRIMPVTCSVTCEKNMKTYQTCSKLWRYRDLLVDCWAPLRPLSPMGHLCSEHTWYASVTRTMKRSTWDCIVHLLSEHFVE